MDLAALMAGTTGILEGVQGDVFAVCMACINILLVLAGGRIIYAVITHQSIIPESMQQYDDIEKEYEGMLEQEERKYHQGIMRNNAKLEIKERHKYDL